MFQKRIWILSVVIIFYKCQLGQIDWWCYLGQVYLYRFSACLISQLFLGGLVVSNSRSGFFVSFNSVFFFFFALYISMLFDCMPTCLEFCFLRELSLLSLSNDLFIPDNFPCSEFCLYELIQLLQHSIHVNFLLLFNYKCFEVMDNVLIYSSFKMTQCLGHYWPQVCSKIKVLWVINRDLMFVSRAYYRSINKEQNEIT